MQEGLDATFGPLSQNSQRMLEFRAQPPGPTGRQPWIWDPATAAYRDADNNLLTAEDIRSLLTRFLEGQRDRAEAITRQLGTGELLVPEWETEMRRVIKDSVGASYLLGR